MHGGAVNGGVATPALTITRLLARVGLSAGLGACAFLLSAGHAAPTAAAVPTCVNQSAPHHATVVVRHGDGRVTSACVGFSGNSIGGKDLLTSSGIEYGFSQDPTLGDEVCQLDYEPSSYPPDCLKQPYWWSIWTATCDGQWAFAQRGIDGLTFADNQAEGFSYIAQGGSGPPPSTGPAGPCPPPAVSTGNGGSGGGGGSGGSNSPGASGAGGAAGSRAGASTAPAQPTIDPSAGGSPDAGVASANPGEVALGGGASPAPSGAPATPLLATGGSSLLGIGTAGLVAVGLIALLVVQLVVPRLRR